jgi:hypothetical protein
MKVARVKEVFPLPKFQGCGEHILFVRCTATAHIAPSRIRLKHPDGEFGEIFVNFARDVAVLTVITV